MKTITLLLGVLALLVSTALSGESAKSPLLDPQPVEPPSLWDLSLSTVYLYDDGADTENLLGYRLDITRDLNRDLSIGAFYSEAWGDGQYEKPTHRFGASARYYFLERLPLYGQLDIGGMAYGSDGIDPYAEALIGLTFDLGALNDRIDGLYLDVGLGYNAIYRDDEFDYLPGLHLGLRYPF